MSPRKSCACRTRRWPPRPTPSRPNATATTSCSTSPRTRTWRPTRTASSARPTARPPTSSTPPSGGRPGALGYVDRIQAAHDTLARLFEDVRALAPSLRLERKPCDVAGVWRRAWDELEPLRRGRDASLTEQVAADELTCSADEFRLE